MVEITSKKILWGILFCSVSLFGNNVSETLAVKMANYYVQSLHTEGDESVPNIRTHNDTYIPERISPLGKAYMWLVPVSDGWVLLSSNTKVTPILAHIPSYEKPVYDSLPPATQELINGYEEHIAYINDHYSKYDIDVRWLECENLDFRSNYTNTTQVGPLLSEKWDQTNISYYPCSSGIMYNKFCPYVDAPSQCDRAAAGCVAVAIAQIMHYWNWPYAALVPTTVGGSVTELKFYNWEKMPDMLNITTPMDEVDMVAGFLRDCGYKLDMDYGVSSGATDANALHTLEAWGYDENTLELRSKWNTSGWTNKLRSNIDAGKPVYYGGRSQTIGGEGHAFVVDGYRTGYGPIYHINFGWGGYANGWYNIDSAYVNESTHYDHWQTAIFGIRPAPVCSNVSYYNSSSFPSKFCYAIGGDISISNSTMHNIEQGEIYSSSQVRLLPGTTIEQGSNVHIAIKNIPCNSMIDAVPSMHSEQPASKTIKRASFFPNESESTCPIQKIFRNGQLLIKHHEKTYTVQGVETK